MGRISWCRGLVTLALPIVLLGPLGGCGSDDAKVAPAGSLADTGRADTAASPPDTANPATGSIVETVTTVGTTSSTTPTVPSTSARPAPVVATITEFTGDVVVLAAGTTTVATPGIGLVPGATVSVNGPGRTTVSLGSGAVVRLGDDSAATFTSRGPDDTSWALARGAIWATAPTADTTTTTIDIAGASVTSAGARLYAGCADDACFVGTVDGVATATATATTTATVAASADASVALPPFRAITTGGGTMSPPSAFPPSALRAIPFAAENVLLDEAAALRAPVPDGAAVTDLSTVSLDGSYTVTYRTVESDRDDIDPTSAGVDRAVTVRTECAGIVCTLVYATEMKGALGDTVVAETPLTFDGAQYHGTASSLDPCDDFKNLVTVEDAIAYTGLTDVSITSAAYVDGIPVATGLDVRIDETNVVTDAGRAIDCVINLRNDGYSAHAVVVGVGTRT